MECIASLLSRVIGPGNILLGISWFLVVEARAENLRKKTKTLQLAISPVCLTRKELGTNS